MMTDDPMQGDLESKEAILGREVLEEEHVRSLRRFRTQQAIRNILLEREVKILQVQFGNSGKVSPDDLSGGAWAM
jgi:hypothetical protein